MMEALISGRLGKAAVWHDGQQRLIDVHPELDSDILHEADLAAIAQGPTICMEGPKHSIDDVRRRLASAWVGEHALSRLIAGLDSSLTPKTRILAIEAAEELLGRPGADYARARLLGIPQPESAEDGDCDLTKALTYARDVDAKKVAKVYEAVKLNSHWIATVHNKAKIVVQNCAPNPACISQILDELINSGLFADCAKVLANNSWPELAEDLFAAAEAHEEISALPEKDCVLPKLRCVLDSLAKVDATTETSVPTQTEDAHRTSKEELQSALLMGIEHSSRSTSNLDYNMLTALWEYQTHVNKLFNLNEVLTYTIHTALKVIAANAGNICLMKYETAKVELRACYPEDSVRFDNQDDLDLEVVKKVMDNLQPLWIDASRPQKFNMIYQSSDYASRYGKLIFVPINTHNSSFGTLSIRWNEQPEHPEHAERFLQALTSHLASTIERVRLLKAFYEIGPAINQTLRLDQLLEEMLNKITENLGFEFAVISLVDDYRRVIESVRGKNVPYGWAARARHGLNTADIQADIVRTRNHEVIEGWDNRFDKELYDRFHHSELTRIFAPIIVGDKVVGTIEAGCKTIQKNEIFTQEHIDMICRLGQENGEEIKQARPFVLLENIAYHAVKIIGADSASIHILAKGETLLKAGTGRVTPDFMREFEPRKKIGIGHQALTSKHHVVIDDPEVLRKNHSTIYDKGMRAVAAIPFHISQDYQGVLYVHFWRTHKFSEAELALERAFTRQIVFAIQNFEIMKRTAAEAGRAWTLASLQNVIQSVVSESNLNVVLEEVAQNALFMADADNVIIYQYFSQQDKIITPPVMKGSFRQEKFMVGDIRGDEIVARIVKNNESKPLYVNNVSGEPHLYEPRITSDDKSPFVEREGIASSAILILRAQAEGEIMGVMFANYRKPRIFNGEDKQILNTLAHAAAIAINTRRLYDQVEDDLRRHKMQLDALIVIDREINQLIKVNSQRVAQHSTVME